MLLVCRGQQRAQSHEDTVTALRLRMCVHSACAKLAVERGRRRALWYELHGAAGKRTSIIRAQQASAYEGRSAALAPWAAWRPAGPPPPPPICKAALGRESPAHAAHASPSPHSVVSCTTCTIPLYYTPPSCPNAQFPVMYQWQHQRRRRCAANAVVACGHDS